MDIGHIHEHIDDHNHNHEYMLEGVIGAGKEVVQGERGEFGASGQGKHRRSRAGKGGG